MNFGPLFRGATFFHKGYLAHFLSERKEIWGRLWGLPIDTYSPNFVNFGLGSRGTMRRHASVLHWHTCRVVLRQLFHVCRQFWCSFYSLPCPRWNLSVYKRPHRAMISCDSTVFLLTITTGQVLRLENADIFLSSLGTSIRPILYAGLLLCVIVFYRCFSMF